MENVRATPGRPIVMDEDKSGLNDSNKREKITETRRMYSHREQRVNSVSLLYIGLRMS